MTTPTVLQTSVARPRPYGVGTSRCQRQAGGRKSFLQGKRCGETAVDDLKIVGAEGI